MNKIACGFVCFRRKLVVFGGCGIAPRSIQPESEFIPSGRMVSTGHLGWTNEFHFYDLETGKLNSTPFENLCTSLKVCTPLSLSWPPFHYYTHRLAGYCPTL